MTAPDTIRGRCLDGQDRAKRLSRTELRNNMREAAHVSIEAARIYGVVLSWIDRGLPLGRCDDAAPAWVPLTTEVFESLQPRTHCWIRFGRGEPCMAWFHVGSGTFRILPDGDWIQRREITHIIVLPAPGAPT